MKRRIALISILAAATALQTAAQEAVDFDTDIRPMLSNRCFQCHGPDGAARKAGLRLDVEAEAKAEVIVVGDPDASELVKRISSADPDHRMPPPEANKAALNEHEIAMVRQWIADGAPWSQHWAFVTPERPALPEVEDASWALNPIDRFVLARLEKEGLEPSPVADRATLIRRLSFDLTGLPPKVEDIDAFMADLSPDAYEKVVERFLASPAYGERMAMDWLDGARYADTNGYQNDFGRNMWPWRDWVIEAYNANMPFDQFTIEQIAGDLLPDASKDQRIATGFVRNNRSVTEGGSIEEEWLVENLVDRVETTSTVFLGLTMGCARCHDHKYDPVSQKEFYEFYAFFNSTADKGYYNEARGNTGPVEQTPTEENLERIAKFDDDIQAKQAETEEARKQLDEAFAQWREDIAKKESPPALDSALVQAPLDGSLLVSALGAAAARVPSPLAYPAGDAAAWREGPFGQAIMLNGSENSFVDFGPGLIVSPEEAFSIWLWIRPEGSGAIASKMDDSAANRGFDVLINGKGQIEVHLIHAWPDNAIKAVSESSVAMGVWNHVAVTYDGSGKAAAIGAYLNGEPLTLVSAKDTLSGAIDTEQPFRLGRRSTGAFLKGAFTDFRFYDRQLAPEGVASLVDTALVEVLNGDASESQVAAMREYYDGKGGYGFHARLAEAQALEQRRAKYIADEVPTVMVLQERDEPRPTYLLRRGEYDKPDKSEELDPGIPAFLPSLPEDSPQNRLGLAKWLVSEENPLTARVTVNRLWQRFFGKGIVKTQEDFGLQGDPPTHPQLLDWLATEFVASGWDLKHIQKLIVSSATYQQQSALRDDLRERDPENRLLARGPRFRLPAEVIRDNALAVSGLLVREIGGPSVKPYQPDGVWEELAGGASQGPYIQDHGDDLYRRSLYTYRKRTVPHPTLTTFDAPSWEVCQVRRSRTNTPLQALALLNDTTYVEAARNLAERMLLESDDYGVPPAAYGFRLVTGRYPSDAEMKTLLQGLQKYMRTYSNDPAKADAFVIQGESPLDEPLNPSILAAHTALATVLLNLDEAITKE